MAILNYGRQLGYQGGNAGQTAINTAQSLQGLDQQRQQQEQQRVVFEQKQQQQLAQQQEVQRVQAARQEGAELLQNGTPSEIAAFGMQNPNVMKDFITQANFKDQTAQGTRIKYAQDVLSGTINAKQAIDARIIEVERNGGDASGLRQTAQGSEAEIIAAAEKDLAVMSPKMYESYRKATGKGKEKSLPAETVAFNDLIKDFSPKEKTLAKRVKAGLKGRAVSNAVLSAIASGDIKNLAQAKAEIKQAEKFGEMTGTSRAKAIDKGFDSIVKIDAGIRNIDRAISALDRGAGVGAVEKLWPSIKAASVELDNIQGQMALDVVGATTFGALSKGELDLAKAIALPTGLDTPELKVFLNSKRTAQEKLKAYFNEQIQFLDQGGTVAGFSRQKEKELTTQGAGSNQDNQAMEWAQANPNDPRAAAILQKLQGNQ